MRPRRDTARAAAMVSAGIITADRACEGKARYTNQNDARHAAKLVQRTANRKATTYRCPFCDGYHITKFKHGEEEE